MSRYYPDRSRFPAAKKAHWPIDLESFLVLVMLCMVAVVLGKIATLFMQGDIPGVFAGALSVAWAWTCIQTARLVKSAGGAQ